MCGGVGVVVCSHAWKLGQWVSGSSHWPHFHGWLHKNNGHCPLFNCLTKWQWRVVYKPCLTGESPQLLVVSQAGNISLLRAYAPEGLGNVIPSTVQLNYIIHKKSHATSQQPKISDFTLSKTVNDGKLKFSQIVHNRERMRDFHKI